MVTLVTLMLFLPVSLGTGLHKIDPRTNLWVTWANKTNRTAFCLSLASASDPFRTCLLGVPQTNMTLLSSALAKFSTGNCTNSTSIAECSGKLLAGLNTTLPWDPQELDLAGSEAIANITGNEGNVTCVKLGSYVYQRSQNITWLTPHNAIYNRTYCGGPVGPASASVFDNFNGTTSYGWGRNDTRIWANKSALALPDGIFLICGDRAWHGVPQFAHGGPCYLGSLTLLALDKAILASISQSRSKRDLSQLPADCNDKVELWSPALRTLASIVPGVGTAYALATLGKLACWTVKQSNVTTQVIEQLSEDMDSLRHAVLQNRAAIDFLLLAQGHGCEEFEGMCCFNLSTHGESIHQQLKWLKEHTQEITVESNPFDKWLGRLFGGLSPWLTGLLKEGFRWFGLALLLIIGGRIVLGCVMKQVDKATVAMTVSPKENGGIVGEWLQGKGHVPMQRLADEELHRHRTQIV